VAKSFHELSSRSQLITCGVLSLLAAAAGWQLLIVPSRTDLASRQAKYATLQSEVSKASAVARRLPQAQREVKQLEIALRETEAVLPEEKDPQDVLRNLHELASESLLDISSFKPKAVVARAQYTEWPIELGLEGNYHDIGRFFDRIASMSRLMSVSNLDIKTKSKPTSRGTVSVSCVATTFVFQKDLALPGDQP
jgi:type IV pilus assembly protein PilO